MPRTKGSVALAVCDEMPEHFEEMDLLLEALRRRGLDARQAVWSNPSVDWSEFGLVVIRATWDYVWRRDEFLAWSKVVPSLANPAEILAWNTDKRYLIDLVRKGVPVVPTQFIAPGEPVDIPSGEVVVKPAVGMGSIDASLFGQHESEDAADYVRLLQGTSRTAMVQPYRERIDEAAETGLVYLDGRFSHAIRKGPMLRSEPVSLAGRWREEVISSRVPDQVEREVAEAALDAVPRKKRDLLYARVDLVPGPSGPEVLELEATEPALHLQHGEGSSDRFAGAIVRRLGEDS